MDRRKVRIGMIIPRPDMVDRIGARTPAHMTDPPVITKYPLTLSVPRFWEPNPPIAAFPLPGSHADAPSRRTTLVRAVPPARRRIEGDQGPGRGYDGAADRAFIVRGPPAC